jgi:isoamylase
LTGVPDSKNGWADVSWYSPQGTAVEWHVDEQAITCLLAAPQPADDPKGLGRDVLLLINSGHQRAEFLSPAISKSKTWRKFVDTSLASPNDVYPELDGPKLDPNTSHVMPHKSLAVFIADR